MRLASNYQEVVEGRFQLGCVYDLVQVESELHSVLGHFIEDEPTAQLLNRLNQRQVDALQQVELHHLRLAPNLLKPHDLLVILDSFLSRRLRVKPDLVQIPLQLHESVVSCLVQPLGLLCYLLPAFIDGLPQVLYFLDDFSLHLVEMLLVLLPGCVDLEEGVPVLGLDGLETLLQTHDLLHVGVLRLGVVLLRQLLAVELHQ